jgi:hypothetical protein
MNRVFVIAVSIVVEVVSISIIINNQVCCRVVTGGVVVICWLIISIQWLGRSTSGSYVCIVWSRRIFVCTVSVRSPWSSVRAWTGAGTSIRWTTTARTGSIRWTTAFIRWTTTRVSRATASTTPRWSSLQNSRSCSLIIINLEIISIRVFKFGIDLWLNKTFFYFTLIFVLIKINLLLLLDKIVVICLLKLIQFESLARKQTKDSYKERCFHTRNSNFKYYNF